jgi:threonine synthase
MNPSFSGFKCVRVAEHIFGASSDVGDKGLGCPDCYNHARASVAIEHNDSQFIITGRSLASGMVAYSDLLACNRWPTLGEGNTPVLELPDLASKYDVLRLRVKNEAANPTGSHKDRMSPLACARALDLNRDTVVCASSGNAGASLAAYAARAGLNCKIISTSRINPVWEAAICETGAELLITSTAHERWRYMAQMAQQEGWYPVTNFLDPPVGSNPFGVEGYQTVAWEIIDQAAAAVAPLPTHIIVPTARGDLLWGIWQGFRRAHQAGIIPSLPQMVAVEPVSRIEAVIKGSDYFTHFSLPPGASHSMSSIGGDTVTYQSVAAVRASNGTAITVSNDEAIKAKHELSQSGLFVELSAAASLAALAQLQTNRTLPENADVMLVTTSSGYKDVGSASFPSRRREVSPTI